MTIINDELCRNCLSDKVKFKTSLLKSSLCDYGDPYILAKGSMTVAGINTTTREKRLVFQNCAPFIECISEIKNEKVDDAKYI